MYSTDILSLSMHVNERDDYIVFDNEDHNAVMEVFHSVIGPEVKPEICYRDQHFWILKWSDVKAELDAIDNFEDEACNSWNEPPEDYLSDVEADAMTFASAGWGEDEMYGYFGEDEY